MLCIDFPISLVLNARFEKFETKHKYTQKTMNIQTNKQPNKHIQNPYFGGERACEGNQPDFDPKELICGGCCDAKNNCTKHGTEYIEWKCKFCCNVALWFCWGKEKERVERKRKMTETETKNRENRIKFEQIYQLI